MPSEAVLPGATRPVEREIDHVIFVWRIVSSGKGTDVQTIQDYKVNLFTPQLHTIPSQLPQQGRKG